MRRTWERAQIATVAGMVTAASGLIELLRSTIVVPFLVRLSSVPPLEPGLALAVFVLGLGLLALPALQRSQRVRRGLIVASVMVVAVALVSLLTDVLPDQGLHAAVVHSHASIRPVVPGLRAPHLLGSLTVLCAACSLFALARARAPHVASVFAVLVVASGLFVLLRFLYDGHPDVESLVSWTTVLTPLSAGSGLLVACGASVWPTRLFFETSVRSLLLRWLLPSMTLVVLVTDLAMAFLFAGFSSALGSALNFMVSIAAAMVVISYLGRAIEAELDRQRSALRASEEKFRTVFATVPAGLALTEFEDGRFVDVNEEFERLYGWSKRETRERTSVELGIWGDAAQREQLLAKVVQEGGATRGIELSLRRRDGVMRVIRTSIRMLELHGRKLLVTASIDITGAKEAADALRRSEEKFSTIFRESPLSLAVTEYETGRYVDVNEAFLKLTGAPSAEFVLGKTAAELGLLTPEDRKAAVRAALAAGKRYDVVISGKRLTGESYTGQLSVSSYWHEGRRYILGGMIDLTQREHAERERLRAEQRFRDLIDGVPDVVFALTPDGVITSLNPAFERMTGMSTGDWLGRPFDQLVHPDDVHRMREEIQAATLGQATSMLPLLIATGEGSYRPCEVSWATHLEEGRVVSVFGIGRDILERVNLEGQLRQSQKMEAVGQLAGGIAHDFNNLLNVIILSCDFVLMSLAADRPERKDIERTMEAALRAAELTRQLLAFSRRQLLEPRDLDLNVVVVKMRQMLERLLGEHVVLRDVPAAERVVVRVDESQMEQVIMNLAVNARDAMPQGGELTMATSNVEFDEASASAHPGAHAGRYVCLSVSDTGVGMTASLKARIFEPFFTTKGVGKGTGLGLSTVFGIVRQSGGFIAVESEPGQGARFDVYLPQVEPSGVVDEEQLVVPARLEGSETILLTEDNAVLRELMAKVLRGYGYTVLEASNAETALLLAERHPGALDVLVTDVVMPGMNGRALADALVRTRPELRVLFASGHSDDAIADQGVLAPGVMLLRKPFSPEALARKVRDLFQRQPKRSSP